MTTNTDDEDSSTSVSDAEDRAVQSKKPEVIEIVFERLMGAETWPVNYPLVVDSDLLVEAIAARNSRHAGEKKPLSTKNPANFLKDFIRKSTCNKNWPQRLTEKRITARQVYGDKQVFEFVDFSAGDTLPFPDRYDPVVGLEIHQFEALSIPVEARKLGRQDEPWLIQIAVSQRLITTHLAIEAAKSALYVDTLAHLQVSVKTQPEIDATFIASVRMPDGNRIRAYVTVEAKQIGERILEHQIREQIGVAFSSTELLSGEDAIEAVIPIVLKVVGHPDVTDSTHAKKRYIYIAQFEPIARKAYDLKFSQALHEIPLKVQSAALYEPCPPIAGISSKTTSKKKPKKSSSGTP